MKRLLTALAATALVAGLFMAAVPVAFAGNSSDIQNFCSKDNAKSFESGDWAKCRVYKVVKVVDTTDAPEGFEYDIQKFVITVDGNEVVLNNKGYALVASDKGGVVKETDSQGFASSLSGKCGQEEVTADSIQKHETPTCTVTNAYIPPTVAFHKAITSEDAGPLTSADFTIHLVSGEVAYSGHEGDKATTVKAGTYTVSESQDTATDKGTYSSQDGGGCYETQTNANTGEKAALGNASGETWVCGFNNQFTPTSQPTPTPTTTSTATPETKTAPPTDIAGTTDTTSPSGSMLTILGLLGIIGVGLLVGTKATSKRR